MLYNSITLLLNDFSDITFGIVPKVTLSNNSSTHCMYLIFIPRLDFLCQRFSDVELDIYSFELAKFTYC